MKPTIIYFLRHGEVENPQKILYGRLPGYGLSKNGLKRIGEVSNELHGKKIDLVFMSPLLRARQTARIICKAIGLKPRISELLLETKAIHDGIALEVFKRDIQFKMYDDHYIKLGQESVETQEKRMSKFVNNTVRKFPGKTILAISHGDPIIILKAKLSGIPFSWEFKRDNYVQPGHYIKLTVRGNNFNWDKLR